MTTLDHSALASALADYLPRQRWFAGDSADDVVIESAELTVDGDPALWWVLAICDGARYQVPVGARRLVDDADVLQGKERVTLGVVDGIVLYDALFDPELALEILRVVAPDEKADVARPLPVEQSNSSVVYDEQLILKLFRRIHDEPNPDVEIAERLSERDFPHAVPQVASLSRDGRDLAVVRSYLLEATDGWHLAQTSLRDLFAARLPPEECGADFGPEAARIGQVLALLHLELADIYPTTDARPADWLDGFRAQLARVDAPFDRDAVHARYAEVASLRDAGKAIRLHGDLHLGQVLLGDAGWFVIDFEGEPNRPVAERTDPSSPLRDVAGMLRSFDYAARSALLERFVDVDDELEDLATAWQARAYDTFSTAYFEVDGIDALLPADPDVREVVVGVFELDKAVYEVGYEQDHRPDWVTIPLAAIERLTRSNVRQERPS